jgi:hypothetical protein
VDSRCAALIFLPPSNGGLNVDPILKRPRSPGQTTPPGQKKPTTNLLSESASHPPPSAPTGGNTTRLFWLAHDKGEIWDVAIPSTEILDRRTVHSSRVTHLLRCDDSILSIDESGNLKIWSPDSRVCFN